MIVTTKGAAALLKKAIGKDASDVLAYKNIIESFKIDPTTFTPEREVYVVNSEDIRGKTVINQFIEALSGKHPKTKVVFIDKGMKATFLDTNIPGLDLYLKNPKADVLAARINELISIDLDDVVRNYEKGSNLEDQEDDGFNPEDVFGSKEEEIIVEPEPDFIQPDPIEEEDEFEIPVVKAEENIKTGTTFVERLEDSKRVADMTTIMKEISATALMKELIDNSSSYQDIEINLKSLDNTIFEIMSSPDYKTESERYEKVRAVLYDKSFYTAKGDTLIFQLVENIINTLCDRFLEVSDSRLNEIDRVIKRLSVENEKLGDSVRLAGLTEERANILAELQSLLAEITELFTSADNAIANALLACTQSVVNAENGVHIRDIIAANGGVPIQESTYEAIRGTVALSQKVGETTISMREKCLVLISMMQKIMDLDRDVIMAQAAQIRLIKARNTDDLVSKHSILKSTLRMYIGLKGSGSSIIPYILSNFRSRQNANVLYLDVTGENRLSDYGITTMSLNEYMEELPEKQACYVVGSVEDTTENAQTLLNALYKAADYYKHINLIVRPDQEHILNALSVDTSSMNYIVEPTPENIDKMREIIKKTDYSDVGKRILLNKCGVSASKTLRRLDMDERVDISLVQIPYMLSVASASFEHYNPCQDSEVIYAMEEVLRKCYN